MRRETISQRNIIIILILLLIMTAWMVESVRKVDNINSDMHVVATMVAKDMDPDLYLRDVNYSTNELYQFYTPIYRWMLRELWQLTGNFEVGLVWLTPFVLGAYLSGMFLLLMRVVRNPWLALGMTVASAGYYETMGEEIWGSGASNLMLARTIFTATVPFLTILALDVWQKPAWGKAVLLGFGSGLAANLHPPSGMHFAAGIMAMLLLLHGFRSGWLRIWTMLGAIAVAVLAGVGLTSFNYVHGTSKVDLIDTEFQTLYSIVSEWYDMPFRPLEIKFRSLDLILAQPQLEVMFWTGLIAGIVALGMYFAAIPRWPGLKRWVWLIGGVLAVWYAFAVALFNLIILFIIVALYIIYRFVRRSITQLDGILVGWVALIIAQSFIGYYLIVRLWEYSELVELTTLVGEQPRAGRFIYLPIFLLVALAALALVKELAHRWHLKEDHAGLSVSIGVFVALGPGLSNAIALNFIPGLIALLVVIVAVAVLAWWLAHRHNSWLTRWGGVLGLAGAILILFGPLAPVSSPYLHIPAVNLLNAEARAPSLAFKENDQALYDWTTTHTEQNALFFWCDFGPITTLHFRLKAERGLTHHWRDLNQRTYNPGTLVIQHERYRQFERACRDLFTAVAAAAETGADFILVPSNLAENYKAESCFFNQRYAVFPVHPRLCPAS